MMGGKGVVNIQSGSSSCPPGYGDSSSSSCLLSASLCIHFIASTKEVGLDAESTSRFSTPPHPALCIAGEPRDISIPQMDDPQPEPSARDNPTSMGEPSGRPSNNRSSCLVTGEAMPLARPPMPESPDPSETEADGWYGGGVLTICGWCSRTWYRQCIPRLQGIMHIFQT